MPVFQRRDAGGIVAAIFEPLERVDQCGRDRLTPENADNSAHASGRLLSLIARMLPGRRCSGGDMPHGKSIYVLDL